MAPTTGRGGTVGIVDVPSGTRTVRVRQDTGRPIRGPDSHCWQYSASCSSTKAA
jgi:hypothetical protein